MNPDFDDFRTVFSCLDNTALSGDDTEARITSLCLDSLHMQDADKGILPVAAVCVYPFFVPLAVKLLKDSPIHVASVAGGFPSGQLPMSLKLEEVQYVVDNGADEVDLVINRGLFLQGSHQAVFDEVAKAKEICGDRLLKVIIEVGELPTLDLVYDASMLVLKAGADFIKTSTGKIAAGATPATAEKMIQALCDYNKNYEKNAAFKVAGGVSTPEEALLYYRLFKKITGKKYVDKHQFRIGTSRLVKQVFKKLTD